MWLFGNFGDGNGTKREEIGVPRHFLIDGRDLRALLPLGAAHHITQRGVDQQRAFFTDADRHTYLDCLQTYSAQARLRILAYCVISGVAI